MPAYWSQLVTQLSTQRARWINQHSSKHGSPSEQVSTSDSSMDQSSPESSSSSANQPLERENAALKRQIAELTAQIDQLRKILDSRAVQIQVLVDCIRHLRLQQRRTSSLSSMDGFLDAEFGEVVPCLNLDDVSSSSTTASSSTDDSNGENGNDLSASFDSWIESDEEEKDEEAELVQPTGSQLGRSVLTPSAEDEKEQAELKSPKPLVQRELVGKNQSGTKRAMPSRQHVE